jgi:hypothetical protein
LPGVRVVFSLLLKHGGGIGLVLIQHALDVQRRRGGQERVGSGRLMAGIVVVIAAAVVVGEETRRTRRRQTSLERTSQLRQAEQSPRWHDDDGDDVGLIIRDYSGRFELD